MTTNSAGSFIHMRAASASINNLSGVESITTKDNINLIELIKGKSNAKDQQTESALSNVFQRLDVLEKSMKTLSMQPGPQGPQGPVGTHGTAGIPGPSGSAGKDGRDGRDGVDGVDGVDGRDGIQGPKGVKGTVERLQDILDVDLNGLEDGSILAWDIKTKKWVTATE